MSRILFRKEGRAKYISHLDIMRTMQRTFLRAGIRIKHTEGYNPHPYMAFALPLPVGTESDCELMDFTLTGGATLEELPGRLNACAPEGITVLAAYEESVKLKHLSWLKVEITLIYDNGVPEGAAAALAALYGRESLVVEKTSKGKTREEDIIPLLHSLTLTQKSGTELTMEAVLAAQNPSLSPALLLSAIDIHAPELSPDFSRVRRREVYNAAFEVFR